MVHKPKQKMDEHTRRKALLGEIVPLAQHADEDTATEAIDFIDRCQKNGRPDPNPEGAKA